MKSKALIGVIVVIVILAAAAAFYFNVQPPPTPPTADGRQPGGGRETTQPLAATGEPIKIGVILPLTGPMAQPGKSALNGINLAYKEFISSNPKPSIRLIVEDSKSDPAGGVGAFNKIVDMDGAKVIIGDIASNITLAFAPLAEAKKVVIMSPGSSSPIFTNAGDYAFRNWVSDNFDGLAMADYLIKNGKRTAAIIYVNNEYGTGLAAAFRDEFASKGCAIALYEPYAQGTKDFRTTIAKLKTISVDVIYLPGQPMENGYIVRQLREAAVKTPIASNLSVEVPDFTNIAGNAASDIVYSTPIFDPSSKTGVIPVFIKSYKSEYGEIPDIAAAHAYDAFNIVVFALKKAGFSIDKLKDSLYSVKDYPGVSGITTFDKNGDVVKDIAIKKLNTNGLSELVLVFKVSNN